MRAGIKNSRMTSAAFVALAAFALVSCNEDSKDHFQGYAEGEYVYVASPVAGRLDKLWVGRGQQVEEGAPLFALESEHEEAEVKQAEEQLASAAAELADMQTGKRKVELNVLRAQLDQAIAAAKLSESSLARDEEQFKIGAISKADLDASHATYQRDAARVNELENQVRSGELPGRDEQQNAKESQVKAAEAALMQAKWRLAQKALHASAAGMVFDTMYVEGEWVGAGNPVVSLLPPANIKVRFFVPQESVGTLKIGQNITAKCDGCAREVKAQVNYISPKAEFTPPVIFSNETRAKLVFMIEAKPATPEDAALLNPGQPLEVRTHE